MGTGIKVGFGCAKSDNNNIAGSREHGINMKRTIIINKCLGSSGSDGSGSKSSPRKTHFSTLPSSIVAYACVLVLFFIFDSVWCDYENTWNFYYEQPCCGSSTGYNSHHVRHHRGEYTAIDIW